MTAIYDPRAAAFIEFIANLQPAWMRDALCREYPDVDWHPDVDDIGAMLAAAQVCCRCKVLADCALYALDEQIEAGVWGGRALDLAPAVA